MSPLFGRRASAETPTDQSIPEIYNSETDPPSLGEFLEQQEESLTESSTLWAMIGQKAKSFDTPEIEEKFKQAFLKQAPTDRRASLSSMAERDATRLIADFQLYSLLKTREISVNSTDIYRSGVAFSKDFRSIPEPIVVNTVLDVLGTYNMADHIVDLITLMRKADRIGNSVVEDVIFTYGSRPEYITQIADLHKKGASKQNPLFAELEKIIGVDWHRPDAQNSLLRQYCQQLKTRDDIQLEPFLQAVENNGGNKKIALIRQMSRFALLSSGIADGEGDIKAPLRATFGQWDSIEGINEAFEEFCKSRITETESALAAIAGPTYGYRQSIRLPRTQQEVNAFKDVFLGYFTDRETRRHIKGSGKRNTMVLPTVKDIDQEANRTIEKLEVERKLRYTKRLSSGLTEFVEIEIDQLSDRFGIDPNSSYAREVQAMVSEIIEDPLGQGTERIKSKTVKITENKSHTLLTLRRFSPHERRGFKTNSRIARQTRIVYGVTADSIVLVDIMTHTKFDQKYR